MLLLLRRRRLQSMIPKMTRPKRRNNKIKGKTPRYMPFSIMFKRVVKEMDLRMGTLAISFGCSVCVAKEGYEAKT